MNQITIKPWLAYSFLIFTCALVFISTTVSAQHHFLQRPRKGRLNYSITPSLGFDYVYVNDRMLSYSTYSTANLIYRLQADLIAHRYDVSMQFKYAPQNHSLHEGIDEQGVLEGSTYELSFSYRRHFSSYYVGGTILGYFSTRETNIYDTRLLLGEVFVSGLAHGGYLKKFDRFAINIHLELPILSYIFGTRYDLTHPFSSDQRLTASQAVPRNIYQRENTFTYLLSSGGNWMLPYQLFYGLGRTTVIYPLRKNIYLAFNYELRYMRFKNSKLFHSYNRYLSIDLTYKFL